MKTYLLLRDNKQSGPYTYEEVIQMGLKAYDLLWLEGKSAAWRYPSEMEEFKSIAPAVEEQPFDRFFRRPFSESSQVINGNGKTHEEVQTIQQEPKEEIISISSIVKESQQEAPPEIAADQFEKETEPLKLSKYVSVSLPTGDQKKIVVVQKNEMKEKEQQKNQEQKPTLNPVFPAQKRQYPEEKKTIPQEKKNNNIQHAISSTPIIEEPPAQVNIIPTVPAKNGNSFMQSAAVVIAILSLVALGVLIGMNIKKKPASDDTAIIPSQEQNLGSNPAAATDQQANENSALNTEPTRDTTVVQQPISLVKENTKKSKKNSESEPAPAETTNDAQHPAQNPPSETVNKAELEKTAAEKEKESARKNIDNLVALNTNKYKVGVFGGIDDLELTVNNNSSYTLDQVVVEVQYVQSNKKTFKTETLHFKDLAPHSSLSLPAPKTNRGIKVASRITYINSKALDLSYNVW